jgi:hypothetical protein
MNHKTDYQNGETLSAAAWNALAADVNELVAGGVNSGSGSSEYLSLSTKNNVELTSPKNINIEPASDSTNNVYGLFLSNQETILNSFLVIDHLTSRMRFL